MNANPKRVEVLDRKHLDRMRDVPCLICGKLPSDPAHLRLGHAAGIGEKPRDDWALPLCHEHHMESHGGEGEAAFWRDKLGRDKYLLADLLRARAEKFHREMG